MTVTVPENTTDNTMAYAINVKYKGMFSIRRKQWKPGEEGDHFCIGKRNRPGQADIGNNDDHR